jgi:hypothetical protein
MASDDIGPGVHYPRLKLALGGDGTNLGDFTGTVAAVTSVANLAAGTVTRVNNVGTVESGTVKINQVPINQALNYGTRGTTGAGVWGTLASTAGAGTKHYVQGYNIVVTSGTVDCAIAFGTAGSLSGSTILVRGQFTPSTGITEQLMQPIASGTGGTITFWMGGAGTVDFNVKYFTV